MRNDSVPSSIPFADLPDNLRLLCSYYKSISEVCRQLNLNRSQFNRYLSGASVPSTYVLRQICAFFGLEHHELFIPHEEFKALLSDRPRSRAEVVDPEADNGLQKHLKRLQQASSHEMDRYLGYYFEFYYSMSYPNKVLQALVHVTRIGKQVCYQRFETLSDPGKDFDGIKCRYEGLAYFLQDRIFFIDYESLTMNEITQTVFYPSFHSKIDLLVGVRLGVAAVHDRKPLLRNVVLKSLGKNINIRACMRSTGLYDADSELLNPQIVERLQAPFST